MQEFMLQLGMMSFQASVVICVVLLVRLLFVRMQVPKKYMCILWILPYLCMMCPWKIESNFGFWRMPEQVRVEQVQGVLEDVRFEVSEAAEDVEKMVWQSSDGVQEEIPHDIISAEQEGFGESHSMGTNVVVNTKEEQSQLWLLTILNILGYVWLAGIAGVLAYSTISYLNLRRKLVCSISVKENIYIADDIEVPFVLGIFKPQIYLPSDMPQESLEYVVAHEETHIRRKDPLKKMLALGISTLHWFNPLSWAAFHFMEKDMEMACDEETILALGMEHKKDYAEALLTLSTGKSLFLGAPLAFDEGNVKGRICNILKYKKTLRVVTGVALVIIAVLTAGFMTRNSQSDAEESEQTTGTESEQSAETESPAEDSMETAEGEETLWRLAEYQVELTGDKIDEQIIFIVDPAKTAGMTNDEILAKVWAGELQMHVRILEGVEAESASAGTASEKVLWEGTYSGKRAENGNLAVCQYTADIYLLRYSNDVADGEGRFWYELLSFEGGEVTVYAANEAVYEVVNAQEIDVKELTAAEQAVVDQVELVEEELQKYLRSNWVDKILLNAVSNPEECYLYQDQAKYSADAFEAFAVQAEGTGFERNIEDFFYTKMEGITEMPEDARERVLAGEVLTLDVSEENATAGNIDLDGDGKEERIYFEALEGYGKYGNHFNSNTDYRLRVDEAYYQDYGSNIEPRVMLYSPDGETILLAIFDAGPSADPLTTFFKYDAESNQVLWAGELPWYLEDAAIEDGVIKSSFRVHMIETQGAMGYWIWDGEKIVRREDDVYEILPYSERYGENGEIYEDGYMKLLETLTVYAERSEDSEAFTMEPQMVLCTSSDLKEWIYLVAKDGTEGWLRVVDMRIPSVENKESREVFDGLGFAG